MRSMLRPEGAAGGKVGHRQTPYKKKTPSVNGGVFLFGGFNYDLNEVHTRRRTAAACDGDSRTRSVNARSALSRNPSRSSPAND